MQCWSVAPYIHTLFWYTLPSISPPRSGRWDGRSLAPPWGGGRAAAGLLPVGSGSVQTDAAPGSPPQPPLRRGGETGQPRGTAPGSWRCSVPVGWINIKDDVLCHCYHQVQRLSDHVTLYPIGMEFVSPLQRQHRETIHKNSILQRGLELVFYWQGRVTWIWISIV